MRTWRWVGALASVVLAGASWGSAALPGQFSDHLWPGLALRRIGDGGSPLLATLAVLAMGVLCLAWWRLRDCGASVGWLQATGLAWFAPLLCAAPLYSRDLYSYAAQGLLVAEGFDPYTGGVDRLDSPWVESTSSVWLDTPAPYGPVFLILARLAATLSGGHLLVALVLLRVAAVAGVGVIFWAVPRLAARLGVVDPARATWLAVLVPLLGAHLVAGGHNDALMVAGLLVAWLLALERRFVLACLVLGVAGAVKLPALVILPFLALWWAAQDLHPPDSSASATSPTSSAAPSAATAPMVRAVLLRSLTASVLTLGSFALVSVGSGMGFGALTVTDTAAKTVAWTSLPTGLGMAAAAVVHLVSGGGTGADQLAIVDVARSIGMLVLAVGLVLLWLSSANALRVPAPAPPAPTEVPPQAAATPVPLEARLVRDSGFALLAVVVMGPAFHGWYLLWFLPLLAAAWASRRAQSVLAAVATALCFLVMPDGYGVALVTAWFGVPLTVAVTVSLLLVGARHTVRARQRRRPRSRPTPAPRSGSSRR